MKKRILLVFTLILTIILMYGCYSDTKIEETQKNTVTDNETVNTEQNGTSESSLNENIITENESVNTEEINDTSELELWQQAYVDFLKNINNDGSVRSFGLKDMDNDSIPELILTIDSDAETYFEFYTYNGSVCKIGKHSDPKTGVSALHVSHDSEIHGVFTMWWGGGVEHFGYLSYEQGKLQYEDLWYIDRTKEPPYKENLSDDQRLIDESAYLYEEKTDDEDYMVGVYYLDDDSILNGITDWK